MSQRIQPSTSLPLPAPTVPPRCRYFLVADRNEMEQLSAAEGDLVALVSTPETFIRRQGAWEIAAVGELNQAIVNRGVTVENTSIWNQGRTPLHLALSNFGQQDDQRLPVSMVPMRRDPAQLLAREPALQPPQQARLMPLQRPTSPSRLPAIEENPQTFEQSSASQNNETDKT